MNFNDCIENKNIINDENRAAHANIIKVETNVNCKSLKSVYLSKFDTSKKYA